jgi:cytochrome c oxidase assembly factor CtaG
MPSLDLAGVVIVLRGDAAGGLAMIVGMLPVGVAAVALCWRWIIHEEQVEMSASNIEGTGCVAVLTSDKGLVART